MLSLLMLSHQESFSSKAKQTCTAATMVQCQAPAQDDVSKFQAANLFHYWMSALIDEIDVEILTSFQAHCFQSHSDDYYCGKDKKCYWSGNYYDGTCKAKEICVDNLPMSNGVTTGLLSALLVLMVLIAAFLVLIARTVVPLNITNPFKRNAGVEEEADFDGADGKSGENVDEAAGENKRCCFGCKKKKAQAQEIDEAVVVNENEDTKGDKGEEKAVESNDDAV